MEEFLTRLAAATPTPGGGAAGGMAAAMAAALGEMACGIAEKRSVEGAGELRTLCAVSREQLTQAAHDDALAFDAVLAAYRLPKTDSGRAGRIREALKEAAESPLAMIGEIAHLAGILGRVAAICPQPCRSDFEAAVVLARAALDIERRNVEVNLDGAAEREDLERRLAQALGDASPRLQEIVI